jgi:hypothetical protein
MVHVVIFQNTQKSGCVYRLVSDGIDITHQTPHQYVSIDRSKYARREVYDWSTQGKFASELALSLDHQPFFWECHPEKPARHLGRPPRHQGYAYWITPETSPHMVYMRLISGITPS